MTCMPFCSRSWRTGSTSLEASGSAACAHAGIAPLTATSASHASERGRRTWRGIRRGVGMARGFMGEDGEGAGRWRLTALLYQHDAARGPQAWIHATRDRGAVARRHDGETERAAAGTEGTRAARQGRGFRARAADLERAAADGGATRDAPQARAGAERGGHCTWPIG